MKSDIENKVSPCFMYLDENSFYGSAISNKISVNDFGWNGSFNFSEDLIMILNTCLKLP